MDKIGKIFHVNFLRYAHWFMSIRISQLRLYYISLDQARCATFVVAKYLDTSTIKGNPKFHNTTLPKYIILTEEYASNSDEQVEILSRECNIHYRY